MRIKEISAESKKHFQQFYPKHTVIGLLEDEMCDRVVLKMRPGFKGWTPTGTARDCGDHYIIARFSRYDMLDKRTMKVTKDVEDF